MQPVGTEAGPKPATKAKKTLKGGKVIKVKKRGTAKGKDGKDGKDGPSPRTGPSPTARAELLGLSAKLGGTADIDVDVLGSHVGQVLGGHVGLDLPAQQLPPPPGAWSPEQRDDELAAVAEGSLDADGIEKLLSCPSSSASPAAARLLHCEQPSNLAIMAEAKATFASEADLAAAMQVMKDLNPEQAEQEAAARRIQTIFRGKGARKIKGWNQARQLIFRAKWVSAVAKNGAEYWYNKETGDIRDSLDDIETVSFIPGGQKAKEMAELMELNKAAIRIQSIFRSHKARIRMEQQESNLAMRLFSMKQKLARQSKQLLNSAFTRRQSRLTRRLTRVGSQHFLADARMALGHDGVSTSAMNGQLEFAPSLRRRQKNLKASSLAAAQQAKFLVRSSWLPVVLCRNI